MVIKSVKLINFRSHEKYELPLNKKTTMILGDNGSGKTSVLEGIYEALQGKSFRAYDRDIVKRNTSFYRVEVIYKSGEKINITYDDKLKKKTFEFRGKKTSRLSKDNKYPVILFLPDDLNLIFASSSTRRDFFDRIISNIEPNYSSILSKYEKALRQRNLLLKKMFESNRRNKDELFSWDVILSNLGMKIREKRSQYIKLINSKLKDVYKSIAEIDDDIKIEYIVENEDYLKGLEESFEKDLILGYTNYGAHRDFFEFIFNNNKAAGSASRGEVRSLILALKFIEADMIYEATKKKPIVLLDDVFSELDDTRRKCLVKNFQDNQVIITSVEKAE